MRKLRKKTAVLLLCSLSALALLCGCGGGQQAAGISAWQPQGILQQEDGTGTADDMEPAPGNPAADNTGREEVAEMKMMVQVGAAAFTAVLEDNTAVDALAELLRQGPVTIQMSDYAGFEKVGPLGRSLPASNQQTTTQAGDIVLYQGDQIVMFYGSNSWSYTRLGHIEDLTGWAAALGSGDVTVVLSMEG